MNQIQLGNVKFLKRCYVLLDDFLIMKQNFSDTDDRLIIKFEGILSFVV